MNAENVFVGRARSLEIYTHFPAGLGHRRHDLRKDMGALCIYHFRTDVHENGVRVQYTGSACLSSQEYVCFNFFSLLRSMC